MKLVFSLFLLCFSIIVVAAIIGTIFLIYSETTLQNTILKNAEEKNLMMVNRIDNYISERTVEMLDLSNDKSIKQNIMASNTEFEKMDDPRQYIIQQNVTWMTVPRYEITPFMKNIIENPTSDRLREQMAIDKAIFHNDVFGQLLIANSYGADVASSIKPDDYDQFTDTWWTHAKQNGFYIGEIYLDNASNSVSIPISIRMNDDAGNFIGVIKGAITANNIIKTISTQMESGKIKPTDYMLLNNDGTVLFSTDPTHKAFHFTYSAEYMKNMQNSTGSFVKPFIESDGSELVVFTRSNSAKIMPTSNWVLVTEYNSNEILKPVVNMFDVGIVMIFILIPVTAISALILSNQISKPIKKIGSAVSEFIIGNMTQIKPSGTDEIKELAVNINQMIERIRNDHDVIVRSEQKYKALFDSAPIAILLTDRNLNIISVNNHFLQLFKYQYNEIIGKSVSTIIADKSIEQLQADKQLYHDIVNMHNKKYWHKKSDGVIFPCLVSVKSAYTDNNEFIAHVAMIKDISELEDTREKNP